jgi:hypothetical protein
MNKRVIVGFLIGCSTLSIHAQTIQNVSAAFADGKVTIIYDLLGGNAKRKYKIALVSSHNSFTTPLNRVTGDVGENITPGTGKTIIWNASDELSKYRGQVTFKVRGEMLAMPFTVISPGSGTGVRRGKTTIIQWEGGLPDQNVKLEIYLAGAKVEDIAETKNTEQYAWAIPKDFKKGKAYTLKITSGSQAANSEVFAVKPKVPLLLKLSPLVVGAAIIPFLGGSGGGEEPGLKLPSPPNPD